jgi:Tol biopolymer transport system component
VFYLHGETLSKSELRRVDLVSGTSDNVLPGRLMNGYEISPDGTDVAFTSAGTDARPEIWLASLDRGSPPRQVTSGGDQPSFGSNGTLVFRQIERSASYLHRINRDGSGGERLLATPITAKSTVSPDGEWVIVTRATTREDAASGGERAETVAISLRGGTIRRICAYNCMPGSMWSPDGRVLSVAAGRGRAVQLPIPSGQLLPDLPASGIGSASDAVKLPGAHLIEQLGASLGPRPSTYVYTKAEIRRNLFRLQLR